jgi:D-arabinose 1-dehydrogenase-like Zn-dependent alcohol dehydrogenase
MHFCGHCEKCVEGLQNQCRTFTVLGNGVDGGNCELIAVPPANVIPIPESLGFRSGGKRAPGICHGLAHARRTSGHAPGANRAGAGREFRRGHRGDSDRKTLPLSRDHDRG